MSEQLDLTLEALPRTLREVADVIGLPGVVALARHWSGRRMYVPQRPNAALVAYLGAAAAQRLCAHYGGDTIEVPACRAQLIEQRDAEIRAARAAGSSVQQLADRYGLSRRQIKYILTGDRAHHAQAG